MSYTTGSVADLEGLLSVIQNLAQDQGWMLESGGILRKGSAYLRHYVSKTTTGNDGPGIIMQGGSGMNAGALTGASAICPRLGRPAVNSNFVDITWPARYHLFAFTGPDEIYVILNFNVTDYYYLAWGVSDIPGLPASGLWLSATTGRRYGTSSSVATDYGWGTSNTETAYNSSYPTPSGGIFYESRKYYEYWAANTICTGLDDITWYGLGVSGNGYYGYEQGNANALYPAVPHIARSANAWNAESALIRIQVMAFRKESRHSMVADLRNARYIRLNNYEPEQVIQLGTERWKLFPFFRKNADEPNGGSGKNHTGTFGWAVRYEGP